MRSYLSNIYGNTSLRERLGTDIERGRLPHALILEGPAGSGKSTLALRLAAALECEHRADADAPLPCGRCARCRKVLSGNATDVHFVTKDEDKATFGIEPVRAARSDMFLSATEFDHKIYIFKDAHLLTPQAQNALLIVLEEPPEGVTILLLAQNAETLLTTVRSRARTYRMERFSTDALYRFLQERHPELLTRFTKNQGELRAVLMGAQGCIGRVLALLDPKETEQLLKENAVVFDIISAMTTGTFEALHTAFRALPSKREALIEALVRLLSAFRDLIACKRAENAPLCFFTDEDIAREYAQKFRLSRLFACADATARAMELAERNANISNLLNTLKCSLC